MKNVADQRYYLVREDVLTDAMQKTLDAKQLLQSGAVVSIWDAVKQVDLSRSAFYKYKDAVFSYSEQAGKIVNLSAVLEDRSGVLSTFIAVLGEMKINILTINQGMPSDGVAQVTVSCQDEFNILTNDVIERLSKLDGVVNLYQV